MNSFTDLDIVDLKILRLLSVDGRISWREVAERVSLSLTPVLRRIRRLEAEGFIHGYTARFDEERCGVGMSVFVQVTLERHTEQALQVFEARVAEVPQVMSCFLMTGDADYFMRIVVSDLKAYHRFLVDSLTRIPGVARIQSSFALKPIIQRSTPPLEDRTQSRSLRRSRKTAR